MALFFWLLAVLLITSAERGNTVALVKQAESDAAGFFVWIVLLAAIGIVRQNSTLRPVANAFLALTVIAFVLRNGEAIARNLKDFKSNAAVALDTDLPSNDTENTGKTKDTAQYINNAVDLYDAHT